MRTPDNCRAKQSTRYVSGTLRRDSSVRLCNIMILSCATLRYFLKAELSSLLERTDWLTKAREFLGKSFVLGDIYFLKEINFIHHRISG